MFDTKGSARFTLIILIVIGLLLLGLYILYNKGVCSVYENDSEYSELYKCKDETSIHYDTYVSIGHLGYTVYYGTGDRDRAVERYLGVQESLKIEGKPNVEEVGGQ